MKKSLVIGVGVVIGALAGLQLFMGTPPREAAAPKAAPAPEIPIAQAVEDEPVAPAAKPEPPPAPVRTPAPPQPRPASPRPPLTKPARPVRDMYYVIDNRNPNGLPSRVTVHNTQIGACSILLLNRNSDGRYYRARGTTSGAQKHRWEVEVISGSVHVRWDGQIVRAGEHQTASGR